MTSGRLLSNWTVHFVCSDACHHQAVAARKEERGETSNFSFAASSQSHQRPVFPRVCKFCRFPSASSNNKAFVDVAPCSPSLLLHATRPCMCKATDLQQTPLSHLLDTVRAESVVRKIGQTSHKDTSIGTDILNCCTTPW